MGHPRQGQGGVRARSRKRGALYRDQRVPLVIELLEENPWCQARLTLYRAGVKVCAGRAVDVHEILSRGRGGSILARENLLCVCRPCHDWITGNPARSEELGLSEESHS